MRITYNLEYNDDYFEELALFLLKEEQSGKVIFPPKEKVFNAFEKCSFENLKVVIIGQDPYHGIGQANGLAFSVSDGIKIPPSLRNIFKEINSDLGIPIPINGDLSTWAEKGVLLLNAVLTVEEGKPGSHQNKGWERFTDEIIKMISDEKSGIVFLLWGNYAKSKSDIIDEKKHLILTAAHPSPLSAYNGFFQCKHFSKTNKYLTIMEKTPIDWSTE